MWCYLGFRIREKIESISIQNRKYIGCAEVSSVQEALQQCECFPQGALILGLGDFPIEGEMLAWAIFKHSLCVRNHTAYFKVHFYLSGWPLLKKENVHYIKLIYMKCKNIMRMFWVLVFGFFFWSMERKFQKQIFCKKRPLNSILQWFKY